MAVFRLLTEFIFGCIIRGSKKESASNENRGRESSVIPTRMVKRITATRELLYLSFIGVQFMAGVRYVMGMFDSDETVRKLWQSVSMTLDQMHGTLFVARSSGPPEALLLILGFMGFGYVLFTIVPGAAVKMERRDMISSDDWE